MNAADCIYCRRESVRGVILCGSPHWVEAGDSRWRNLDGTARITVMETCATCRHGMKRRKETRCNKVKRT